MSGQGPAVEEVVAVILAKWRPRRARDSMACSGKSTNLNAIAQIVSPRTMMGMLPRSMRRLPRRSMKWNVPNVNTKFVRAIVSDVAIGFSNPTMAKIVAEKYMRELKPHSCWEACSMHAITRARRLPPLHNSRMVYWKLCRLRRRADGVVDSVDMEEIFLAEDSSSISSEILFSIPSTTLSPGSNHTLS